MDSSTPQQVTQLLIDWRNGDRQALDRLMPLVYNELRRIAQRSRRTQIAGNTFQTADLIHEAYLKLAGQNGIDWQNRAHFYAVAARVMRYLLIDHARAKLTQKRGGGAEMISLNELEIGEPGRSLEILSLNQALERLAGMDERKSRIVEMRYFAGMNNNEVAEVLGVSEITVKREWIRAKAWLYRELNEPGKESLA